MTGPTYEAAVIVVEDHTPEAHDVIACELVACTLGQRRRPELRVDLTGRLIRAFRSLARGLDDLGRKLAERPDYAAALRKAAAAAEAERRTS